ncbi:MAG: hypothetical protein HY363_00765 [Candidatus Aenigmarchaeota archaeon]|nr:hypothetical protein [Candidatus Aenigmarchaeota archaeon]
MAKIVHLNLLNSSREEALVEHYGRPVLVEKELIPVAQIPISGDELQKSVLVHQRYVPRGIKHRKLNLRGFRRGRTLDVLLDAPIVVNGISYGLLNFKGVGADADDAMVFNLTKWYDNSGWGENSDRFGRYFGAVKRRDAYDEFRDRTLQQYGIPFVEHIAVNDVPDSISRRISCLERERKHIKLSQLVRAFPTNVRMDDVLNKDNYCISSRELFKSYVHAQKLAEIDAHVAEVQLGLAKSGKCLGIAGSVSENRLLNGMFVDAENYTDAPPKLLSLLKSDCGFLKEVLWSSNACSKMPQDYVHEFLARTKWVNQPYYQSNGFIEGVIDALEDCFKQNVREWSCGL